MSARSGELIAADKSTVISKPLLDAIVVEDSEGDRGLSNPTCANEGSGFKLFGMTNDLLDELTASEKGLWRQGR